MDAAEVCTGRDGRDRNRDVGSGRWVSFVDMQMQMQMRIPEHVITPNRPDESRGSCRPALSGSWRSPGLRSDNRPFALRKRKRGSLGGLPSCYARSFFGFPVAHNSISSRDISGSQSAVSQSRRETLATRFRECTSQF